MIRIRQNYDKTIEAFFEMFRFLVIFNIFTFCGFLYILIMHFSDYNGSMSAICASYFPCFAQYSRFSTSADFRYSLTLTLFIVIGVILCIYKWTTYDYLTKRQKYFHKEDNLFAREFFNMWDFRIKRLNDSKHSIEGIQNVLKIMIHEEKIKDEVKNRTSAQKCTLYFIRGCLITLSIFILLLGWCVP